MLEMKPVCEKCQGKLTNQARAYICSYECTFCQSCTAALENTCPNCGGELVIRPTRRAVEDAPDRSS